MAELDKKIEGILLQRLTHIIQVWCGEFERGDEDTRQIPLRTERRRGKKDEKVRLLTVTSDENTDYVNSSLRATWS